MPPGDVLVTVEGLRHRFGDRDALVGVGFVARRGAIVGLLGPNGSGKSTALSVLAGLVRPDAGSVRLGPAGLAPQERAFRARLGVVFQEASLDKKLSARENLGLMARLHGFRGAAARGRVDAMLEMAELADRADEPVARLSGGMRRRLEIARAVLHEPEVLLLDEPTNGLDEASCRRTWAHLRALRDRHATTILLSTHRPAEAEECDEIVILDHGAVVAAGAPEALRQQVSGDVVTLEADDPQALAREVAESLGLAAVVLDGRVVVEHTRGHELIPRLVELAGAGRLTSVSMHRPTLADVFLKRTGRSLAPAPEAALS